jgi:putative intracellular protease/amidase
MHRAGAEGSDGEGITIYDIFRDVAESVAVRSIRRTLSAGDLSPAMRQLCSAPDTQRCRAAAAAAQAVSMRVQAAVQAATSSGGHALQVELSLCRWLSDYPRSIRLALAVCHALGALARAGYACPAFESAGDECVLAALERHADVGAIQAHGLWALRQRLKPRFRRGAAGGAGSRYSCGTAISFPAALKIAEGGSGGASSGMRAGLERMVAAAKAALAAHPGNGGGGGGGGVGDGSSSMRRDATLLVELCQTALKIDKH